MENYQQVSLIIDEMIDEGIVINTDTENIEGKILFREPSRIAADSSSSASSGGGLFKGVYYIFILVLFKCEEFDI